MLSLLQVCMVVYGLSVFFGTPKDARKGRLSFILIICLILATSFVGGILDVWGSFRVLYAVDSISPPCTLYIWNTGSRNQLEVVYASGAAFTLVVTTGDCLMVWRCFILWKNRKWVVILPFLSTLGSFGTFILDFSSDLHSYNANVAALILSVATNVMATALILFPLAQTWWLVSKALPDRKASGMYLNVAAVIIESAAPLTACGIGVMITLALAWGSNGEPILRGARYEVMRRILNTLYFFFSALSPQMIIFRVTMGRSWRNSEDSNGGVMAFSRPIDFARVNNEVEGRDSEPASA
ncbi:hypothetical protein BKA70DRAFT_1098466 [Coprinopsis sp. MPI-PUGE-AT-0042]|nr:hypothetical protein BKA70DRAFT_1098466 [Coprinopsis sp. MPI-PUGE-AT-0042]